MKLEGVQCRIAKLVSDMESKSYEGTVKFNGIDDDGTPHTRRGPHYVLHPRVTCLQISRTL